MSTTAGAGFSTVNLIVGQWTTGVEWESTFYVTRSFRLHAALGWLNVKAERQGGVRPVAPLTPELTLSLSPAYGWWLDNGAEIATRTGAECGGSRVPIPAGSRASAAAA